LWFKVRLNLTNLNNSRSFLSFNALFSDINAILNNPSSNLNIELVFFLEKRPSLTFLPFISEDKRFQFQAILDLFVFSRFFFSKERSDTKKARGNKLD